MKRIDLNHVEDMTSAVEHIRREARLNGYKVVDWDVDEYSDDRYVVLERQRVVKTKPKARFF